jgi:hypothetical protein
MIMNDALFAASMILIVCLPVLLVAIDFFKFLLTGKRFFNKVIARLVEFTFVLLFPFIYLIMVDTPTNDCCSESATFSPEHKLTIYALIALCEVAYFYSSFKQKIGSPILEVLTNVGLLLGVALNIIISVHVGEMYWLIGNMPIIFLFVLQLVKNHSVFLATNRQHIQDASAPFEKIAWKILLLPILLKMPILLVLSLPVLIVITSILLLFGQKPDAVVKAFTDTYYHGFSQLDYMCKNADCGGDHFLCSVAAQGHSGIVKPIRYGERNNHQIICNRQLLIANAFEELVAEKMPKLHTLIRNNYNKVGDVVHKYYYIFQNKLVADFIYILMKPLEFIFIITLYTFDIQPENRIGRQYINKHDSIALNKELIDNATQEKH